VLTLRVYARVSPEHKVRIVKAWQKHGKIVAMTGDGVNDAPSIKAADIGVGMGITGTDVTKGAADMVLEDDNFATIVEAVKEGRKIFANMQKTIQFLLAANIAEVISLLVVTILYATPLIQGGEVAFLFPIQILWINLVTDSLPALALGMEPTALDIMNRPPLKTSDNLFAGRVGVNIIYQGILQSVIVLAVYFIGQFVYSHEAAITMAFITLSMIQLFHCFNAKNLDNSIFKKNFFANKFMLLSFAIGTFLTVGVAAFPFLQTMFHFEPLNAVQWLIALGASILIIPFVELGKIIVNASSKRKITSLNDTE
jgi:Ca2+-transporting ATPase